MQAAAGELATFRALSQVFLAMAPPMLARLCAARAAGDAGALARESHALKGCTVLLGAHALSAVLQQMELQGRAGDAAASEALWPELERLYDLVTAEVSDSIAHYPAPARQER